MRKTVSLLFVGLLVGCQAPITTTFHQALTDPNGYVMDVHNQSDKTLVCRVETDDKQISHEFTLDPNGEQHLGIFQLERSFKSGQHGDIEVQGYSDHAFTAP